MSSPVEIVNMALSHLAISTEIANLDTEKSEEAAAGRRFYEMARDVTLSDFPWPFATKIAVLPLVADQSSAADALSSSGASGIAISGLGGSGVPVIVNPLTPMPNLWLVTEWTYAYRYPTDCLSFRRILSGYRVDNKDTRVPFRQGQDDQGLLIFTDEEDAVGEYTVKTTNTQLFTTTFVMAMSYYLAFLMAARLTGGDPYKLGPRALQLYGVEQSQAAARSLSQEQPDSATSDSELSDAR